MLTLRTLTTHHEAFAKCLPPCRHETSGKAVNNNSFHISTVSRYIGFHARSLYDRPTMDPLEKLLSKSLGLADGLDVAGKDAMVVAGLH